MTAEIVSLLDTSDRSGLAHSALDTRLTLVAPQCVCPHLAPGSGPHDGRAGPQAEAGQGPAQAVAPGVHLDDDRGLLVLDVQLVHQDPGEDEEDPGEDGNKGEDGVSHVAFLEQQQEVDDKVET